MCESDKLHDEINVIDIKIYPNRFLKPKTTELLLNKITISKDNDYIVLNI